MESQVRNLQRLLNGLVTVTTVEGLSFQGILMNYDEHMNLVLRQVKEIPQDNQQREPKRIGLMVMRGCNVSTVEAVQLPEITVQQFKSNKLQIGVGTVKPYGRGFTPV